MRPALIKGTISYVQKSPLEAHQTRKFWSRVKERQETAVFAGKGEALGSWLEARKKRGENGVEGTGAGALVPGQ